MDPADVGVDHCPWLSDKPVLTGEDAHAVEA